MPKIIEEAKIEVVKLNTNFEEDTRPALDENQEVRIHIYIYHLAYCGIVKYFS